MKIFDAQQRTLQYVIFIRFVFWRSMVQILARRLAILTDSLPGFPQPLQANAGIVH
jgi:hypothetical protein